MPVSKRSPAPRTLRHYTNALALIDMLMHKRLTLRSPARWFDQNDALGLETYSKLRGEEVSGEGSVYALCFAIGTEQAHHWQLFASSDHGLCISFDFVRAVSYFKNLPILSDPVKYRSLQEIRDMGEIEQDDLPFLKRDTFEAEDEYRIVAWEESFFADETYAIPIPLDLITRVTFGPAMPKGFTKTLMEFRNQPDAKHITFHHSRLVNNASWADVIQKGVAGRIS